MKQHQRKATGWGAATALALTTLALTAAPALAVGPPLISATSLSQVTETTSTLQATVNPNARKTTYHFDFLSDAAYQANPEADRFAGAASAPVPEGEITADLTADHPLQVPIAGLTLATTYHYRLIATNKANGIPNVVIGPERTFTTYATPIAGLPDSRAYEQASPVNKDGGDATGVFSLLKAAAQGGAVTFLSTSGIPGGCGAQELPLYLATRGATDWSTHGLLPCASYGQRARILGWTPDFSHVFSEATKLGSPQTAALLDRSSADGSITTVAPQLPTGYYFVGASADGSEVLFESPSRLPGVDAAIEGAPNVYAWQRTGAKTTLAGVFNDGSSPPNGAIAGSYDWIHGTTPKSLAAGGAANQYYLQDQRAISADGSVFFTAAGTGQLYLRRNPTMAQSAVTINPTTEAEECTEPAKACTIHLSASQKENGTGPDGTDAAGTRPAAFMAASADGSKAFLTSSEKLTGDANTGVEPALPAIARAGIDGTGTNLSFLPASATALAVHGEFIYWVDPGAGTIGRAKLNGSEAVADFITGANNPQGVAVDDEYVYWTNPGNDEPGEGAIGRAKLGATAAQEVDQDFIAAAGHPRGVAVDDEYLYWTNAALEDGEPGFVGRATLDGTTEVDPEFIETHFTSAFQEAAKLSGIAVDASHLYWIDSREFEAGHPHNWLSRANLDGSGYESQFNGLRSFQDGSTSPHGVAVDASHLYWTEDDANAITRLKTDGTNKEQFIQNAAHPVGLAIDAGNIYWSANQGVEPNPGNDLYRYDAATGKLTDLTVDTAHTNGAEVQGVLGASADGSYLYYVANGIPDGGVTGSPNANGESATPGNCKGNLGSMTGTCNLYLWHEGDTSFIARLDVGGSVATDAANWVPTPAGIFVGNRNFRKTASLSPDGRTLLLRSQRQLDGYENAGTPELYRYRVGEPGPVCISCNPTGAPPTGAPSLGTLTTTAQIPQDPAAVASRNLAADGERVFFETTDALVASDTNGLADCSPVGSSAQLFPSCLDVYEWEANGTGSCQSEGENGGCLYLLSTGKSTWPSFFADASASGDEAFLFTRSALVGQDQDELTDVYSARIGGGLAAQNPPPPQPPCEAEGCKPGPTDPPIFDSPASAGLHGPGDPPPARCRKGFVKRHGRCVKQKKKHHQKKHRRAHHDRRGK